MYCSETLEKLTIKKIYSSINVQYSYLNFYRVFEVQGTSLPDMLGQENWLSIIKGQMNDVSISALFSVVPCSIDLNKDIFQKYYLFTKFKLPQHKHFKVNTYSRMKYKIHIKCSYYLFSIELFLHIGRPNMLHKGLSSYGLFLICLSILQCS